MWVLIFGAIRSGTKPKSSSNWPLPVILPDKTIKFLRQEMFVANGPCQMLLLFLSVVFKDLFLILTRYFTRRRPVLPALLKLSMTLMFVCCLRVSLALHQFWGFGFVFFLIIFSKHSSLVKGWALRDRAGSGMGSSPPKLAEAACTAAGLRSKLENLARPDRREGPWPAGAWLVGWLVEGMVMCGKRELGAAALGVHRLALPTVLILFIPASLWRS